MCELYMRFPTRHSRGHELRLHLARSTVLRVRKHGPTVYAASHHPPAPFSLRSGGGGGNYGGGGGYGGGRGEGGGNRGGGASNPYSNRSSASNSGPVQRQSQDNVYVPISALNPYQNRWTVKAR